ncbi:MAG: hypothetical protein V3V09_02830 [Arenicellales bacterium]
MKFIQSKRWALIAGSMVVFSMLSAGPVQAYDDTELSEKLKQVFAVHEGKVGHLTVIFKLQNHYKKYTLEQGNKAMAVAYQAGGNDVWSFGLGNDADEMAIDRCLDWRIRNRVKAKCKLLARNNKIILKKY